VNVNVKAGLVITATMILTTFVFYGYQVLFAPNILLDKPDGYLYIPTGAKFENVKDSLERNGVLHDKLSFMFLSKLIGYSKKVKPGRYLLQSGDNNWNTVKKLLGGRQEPVKLTFNSIRLKREFAEKVASKFEFSEEQLLSLLNSPESLKGYGVDTSTVMTLFIPNTYEIYWNISAEDFLDKMYQENDKFWTEAKKDAAKALGITPTQVVILASIVEQETQKQDEKSKVAGVYLNRLNKGMKLQADPTVKFAIGDFGLRRIYLGHLAVLSPYNTYLYKGLPPGPICLPSVKTIDATLSAEPHEYLFFCADIIRPGYHKFTKTFGEHLGVANDYRTDLNRKKIK
jgi:UPF0755 protein